MTPKQADAKAKKLFGPKAYADYRPKAMDDAGKKEVLANRDEMKARRDSLEALAKTVPATDKALLDAAEFVLAVTPGDQTALAALRKAHDEAKAAREAKDERRELDEHIRTAQNRTHGHRCVLLLNQGWCAEQIGWGDTWEEAFARAQGNKGAKVISGGVGSTVSA